MDLMVWKGIAVKIEKKFLACQMTENTELSWHPTESYYLTGRPKLGRPMGLRPQTTQYFINNM